MIPKQSAIFISPVPFPLCLNMVLSFKNAKQGLIPISIALYPSYMRFKESCLIVTQGPLPHQMEMDQEAHGQELKQEKATGTIDEMLSK